MLGPRHVSILIVEPTSGNTVDSCRGPKPDGFCPRAAPNGLLPCDGRSVLALRGTDVNGTRLTVGPHEPGICPLDGAISDPDEWHLG